FGQTATVASPPKPPILSARLKGCPVDWGARDLRASPVDLCAGGLITHALICAQGIETPLLDLNVRSAR
ncbi:MAG TPA: hypothetical protein PKA58_26770, partial [Polyangium sp.]|nr:hypothetical protein [Polyangium sp.]